MSRPAGRRGLVVLIAAGLAAVGVGGCGSGSAAGGERVTVLAAASLTAAFTDLADRFRADHPGVTVALSFDGSSTLATQIIGGAPADVFASADRHTMDTVVGAQLAAGDPRPFATNTLTIAVAPGNPTSIATLADLARPGVVTVLCAAGVPCGSAADRVLDLAGVRLTPASREQSVTAALTKVESGEADAALVYRTDVAGSAGRAQGVDFQQADQAVNSYLVTTLSRAAQPRAAQQFVDLVISDEGRQVLARYGFGAP